MCFPEPQYLARASFYLKHSAFPMIAALGREAADGPRGQTAASTAPGGEGCGCWSGERSGITHPQLHLKKGKSQDGCSNPTGDALLRARPCALHLCKRKGLAGSGGRSAEADGWGSRGAVGAVGSHPSGQEPVGPDAAWVLHLASCQAPVGLLTLAVEGHTLSLFVALGWFSMGVGRMQEQGYHDVSFSSC